MKVVAIINPVAGGSRRGAEVRAMIARVQAAGIEIEPRTTAVPGQARQMAAEVADRARAAGRAPSDELDRAAGQTLCVIAVGGDGTIHEVAAGLAGSTVPMVIWPRGTENLVAKSFGFRADPELALACLTAGKTVAVDLGAANGRSFLAVAGVGFDAAVVERLVRLRRGYITHLTYAGPLWRTFWEYRFPFCRVLSEGRLLWEGQGLIFVGNLARYSLGLRVVRDARPDDGWLDLCIFPCRSQCELIAHSLRTIVKKHVEHGGVRYVRLRQVRVESPAAVPVELDGEAAGRLPIDVTVRPAAIRLLVPPGTQSG